MPSLASRFGPGALLLVLLDLLTGCGGGGGGSDGGQDLTVTFSYSGSAAVPAVFLPAQLLPTIGGLGANSPRCAVSGGSLPPGMSLVGGCVISGTPTEAGNFSSTVTLTVDGYRGSVATNVPISVLAPTLIPVAKASAFSADQDLGLGIAVSRLPIVTVGLLYAGVLPYAPPAGDLATYGVTAGSLPPGLSLDPVSGTLSGAPTTPGVSAFTVSWGFVHNGQVFRTSVPVKLAVTQTSFALSYGNCCSLTVGDDIRVLAISTFVAADGATVGFTMFPALPGIAIDPVTGTLSGSPAAAGSYNVTVTERVQYADGSVNVSQAILPWTTVGPSVAYSLSPASTAAGVAFSFEADRITNTLPGDIRSFSMSPYPSSGTVIPVWLSIDAATGRVFGTQAPVPFGLNPPIDLKVVMKTRRNGHDSETDTRLVLTPH